MLTDIHDWLRKLNNTTGGTRTTFHITPLGLEIRLEWEVDNVPHGLIRIVTPHDFNGEANFSDSVILDYMQHQVEHHTREQLHKRPQ